MNVDYAAYHDIALLTPAAKLMVTRYGEAAKLGSAKRAEKLAADGHLAGVAVWLRIIDATGQLAITTPSEPVH